MKLVKGYDLNHQQNLNLVRADLESKLNSASSNAAFETLEKKFKKISKDILTVEKECKSKVDLAEVQDTLSNYQTDVANKLLELR